MKEMGSWLRTRCRIGLFRRRAIRGVDDGSGGRTRIMELLLLVLLRLEVLWALGLRLRRLHRRLEIDAHRQQRMMATKSLSMPRETPGADKLPEPTALGLKQASNELRQTILCSRCHLNLRGQPCREQMAKARPNLLLQRTQASPSSPLRQDCWVESSI